jgi:hypothetical protein
MLWSVYLPEDYRFIHFGGSVEKEKTARGLRSLFGRRGKISSAFSPLPDRPDEDKDEKERYRKEAGKLKKQFSANLALSEEQLIQQMKNEARFGQRVKDIQSGKVPSGAGILSIRIQIPATGQLFRFAKTIVSEESLTLSYHYISNSMFWLIWFGVVIIILLILYFTRKKIMAAVQFLAIRFKNIKIHKKKD